MGANGTATVKVWGPWAVNTGWRPPPMVVEGETGAEQCHEYRVELLDWSHYEELYSGELKVKCCGMQDREKSNESNALVTFSARHSLFFAWPCLADFCLTHASYMSSYMSLGDHA